MHRPEITLLLGDVKEKYGRKLETTTDFDEFSVLLDKQGYGKVSTSTLKRLWGYVSDTRKPRGTTLDILSNYIGFPSFKSYVKDMKTSIRFNSSYFTAQHITSAELNVGAEIEVGWAPNRILRLRYLGESTYEVVESMNSKLQVGDKFMTGCFFKEVPLYLPYIIRDGERTSPFIAGRNGGLLGLNIISK